MRLLHFYLELCTPYSVLRTVFMGGEMVTREFQDKKMIIWRVRGFFNLALKELAEQGFETASIRDIAYARTMSNPESPINTNGSWTAEAFNYFPSKKILVASKDYNILLKESDKAVESHRAKTDFFLTDEYIEKLETVASEDEWKKPAERRVFVLREKGLFSIPVKEFAKNELTVFLFKDMATQYANFLLREGIDKVSVLLAKPKDKAFAKDLWFSRLSGGSELDGGYYNFDQENNLRGSGTSEPTGPIIIKKDEKQEDDEMLDKKIKLALDRGFKFEYKGKIFFPIDKKEIIELIEEEKNKK